MVQQDQAFTEARTDISQNTVPNKVQHLFIATLGVHDDPTADRIVIARPPPHASTIVDFVLTETNESSYKELGKEMRARLLLRRHLLGRA